MSQVSSGDIFGAAATIWREANSADIPPEVRGYVLIAAAAATAGVALLGAAAYFGRSIKISAWGFEVAIAKDG